VIENTTGFDSLDRYFYNYPACDTRFDVQDQANISSSLEHVNPCIMESLLSKMPATAKNVTLYKNGDEYFGGRRFVINRRQLNNMDSFLEHATNGLKPSFGAVRNIYTPDGGTRVRNLEDIQSGKAYVAGGAESFRILGQKKTRRYQEIGTRKPLPIKKTYSHIKPVSHNSAFGQITGRWKQAADEINQPVQMWLHVNGDAQASPVRLLLPSRVLKLQWEMILEYITDRVGARLGKSVRKLHSVEGELMLSSKQLVTGRTYVATGSERFRKMAYRTGGSTQSAPVMKRKPLPPIGIKKRRQRSPINSPVKEYDDIVQQMSARTEAQKGQETDVFAGKAVKVKGRQSLLSPQPPVATGPLKSNSKRRPSYVDEDPEMQNEMPVEMQQAKAIKVSQEQSDILTLMEQQDLDSFSPRTVDSHITEVTLEYDLSARVMPIADDEVLSPEVPNLMQTIPASPGPSHTEIEPSVYGFEKNDENDEDEEQQSEVEEQDETLEEPFEVETEEIQPIGKTLEIEQISTGTDNLAIDSLEARIEDTIEQETKSEASEQESTELPGTPRSVKAAELSDEALTKAISDLSRD